ncbi:embigin [Pelodytes ibericus]
MNALEDTQGPPKIIQKLAPDEIEPFTPYLPILGKSGFWGRSLGGCVSVLLHICGPHVIADDVQKTDERISNSTVIKHTISIPGSSSKVVKKNIILDSSAHLKLACELSIDSKDGQIYDVSWKHNDEPINRNSYAFNNTGNKWHASYEFVVTDRSQIGTYACIFNSTTDVRAEFNLNVPAVRSEKKPLVSYIKDAITMKCDSALYKPIEWIWYQVNGSEQVQLNFSLIPTKYKISMAKANETKLHISDLSDKDSGIYICKAVYTFGEQEGQVELTVLTYMVPLKIFFAIAGEVVILVSLILIYEMKTKKKQSTEDIKKDMEQTDHLKPEESSSAESTTRQRNV